MTKQGQDFSQGSIGRHVVAQAVPLIIAQLIQLLYNLVDRIYIGHLPGENGMALTGIGLVFPIVTLVTAFTNLFGVGGAPLCSIARGAGKTERAEKIMGNCPHPSVCDFLSHHGAVLPSQAAGAVSLRSQRQHLSLCGRLSEDLPSWHGVQHGGYRHEQLHHGSGLSGGGHVYNGDRRGDQSDSGSGVDLPLPYGD